MEILVQAPISDFGKPLAVFDAGAWKEGLSSFGTYGTPGRIVHSVWNTDDIWPRREGTLPDTKFPNLQFLSHHDEDAEIYVNGVLASTEPGFTTSYVLLDIRPLALQLLTPGAKVALAVHCHQTIGGQNVDVGLVNVEELKK